MFRSLEEAIRAQYEAFPSVRPQTLGGCPHCTSPDQLQQLLARPREDLGAPQLSTYGHKAMTTIGGVAEFRYFWPRLAELSISGELFTAVETVFGKPVYGKHGTWPRREQDALLDLAAAVGEWLGSEELEPGAADTWVCCVGELCEGVASPLQYLQPLLDPNPAAWANLLSWVEDNAPTIARKARLSNGFWSNAPASAAEVLGWYHSAPRFAEARGALAQRSSELYGTIVAPDYL
jgi:hypothetical protein